jgi:hypothetical protein
MVWVSRFDEVAVVAGSFDDTGQVRWRTGFLAAANVAVDAGDAFRVAVRGKIRRPGDLAADDAQGTDEGKPVGSM